MGLPLGAILPVIGGAVSAGIDALSGATSAKMSRSAFRHRYQDTVQDMRKAGLNPALAYGQGGGSGAQNQELPELGSSIARGISAAASAKQATAAADLTGSQAALLKAQSIDLIDQVRIRNEQMAAETGLTTARIATERKRPEQIRLAIMQARVNYRWASDSMQDRIDLVHKQLQRQGLEISRAEIENELLRLSKPAAKAEADFYSGAGKYSPYLNSALDVLRTLMPKVNIGPRMESRPPVNIRIGK